MLCAATLPLSAAGNDPGAGNWKMIVLTGPTQIPVPPPAPITDAGYQSELAAVKAAQAHLTSSQRTAIANWKAGGIVRWNQILLELVASADLPPEPNADGTYSFPNAANRSRSLSSPSVIRRMPRARTAMSRPRSLRR
ncbi:MAG: hypothetical protein WDO73_31995 [Ignavibacteriota bacterium]